MFTDSLTAPSEETGHERCRCGCAPCRETCCRLECLVKPRFFCGQLLTDQDLKALVDWTAGKFRLTRYRHGWGVICGLEVRCDPKRPSGIIVAPGYAIDCCGNDIIVCSDYRFDAAKWCPPQRCEGDYRDDGLAAYQGAAAATEQGGAVWDALGMSSPFQGTTPLDIFIEYAEQGADPKPPLGRCGCGETAACEDSRTHEGFRLTVAAPTTDDQTAQARQYGTEMSVVRDFVGSLRNERDGEAIRRKLMKWLGQHPLRQFCFLSHLIERLTAQELLDTRTLVSIVFWLVQDYRNERLSCGCYACEADAGVPIARIWVDAGDRAVGKSCHVVAVEWRTPYRRPLAPVECWPVRPGCVSLASWVWRDPEEAAAALNAAGVPAEVSGPLDVADWAAIDRVLACNVLSACQGDRVVMQTFDAGEPLGTRVLGFCPPAGAGNGQTESQGGGEGGEEARGRTPRRQTRGSRT